MKAHTLIPRLWVLISLLFSIHTFAQKNIVGYEYAFNNGEGLQYVGVTPTPNYNLNTSIDVSSLTSDINVINIRFKDSDNVWSSIISSIFITPPVPDNIDTEIVGYEYAFNDGEGLTYVPITPAQNYNLVTDIDVNTLPNDINVFHIRFIDSDDKWSAMVSHIFIRPPEASNTDTNIVGYEYGVNDGDDIQYVPVSPAQDFNLVTDIDVNALPHDINVFHVRFKADDGKWSSMISHIFIRPPVASNTDTNIVGYEYGFNDGEDIQYVPVSPAQDFNLVTDIDVNALPHDINVFHVRFKADDGKWSSMISHIFIRPPVASNTDTNIVGYEYGFNDGEDIQYVPVSPAQDFNLVTDIDVSALPHDINVFHIRFKADDGKWSSMISHIFIRPPVVAGADANIVGYEYAFNDDSNVQFTPIAPTKDYDLVVNLNTNGLTSHLNILYIRFLDDTGKWSSMIHQLFMRPPEPMVYTDNKMVAYDYWFDHDESTKVTVDVETPAADLLVAEVDMSQLWAGEHQIHTQFKDAYNNYSLVMTDTIDKQVLPIASFVSDLNSICVGETINFTNNSIDYDAVAWDFDDGNSSTDFNTSHTFNTAGTFDVNLTVSESVSGLDSIASQSIEVFSYPVNTVTASGSLQACYGSTVTLTADDANADYLWSNGATTQSIDVVAEGTFSVSLTRTNASGCTVVSNDLVVTFNPEIDNSTTYDDTTITANQTGANYQWIDCTNGNSPIDGATEQVFLPIQNGEYAVEISLNGCTSVSDCVTMSNLSATDFKLKQMVKIYPNPIKNQLQVKTEIDIDIDVYNILGQRIISIEQKSGKGTIDMSTYNNGMYLLKVRSSNNQNTGIYRIIKN